MKNIFLLGAFLIGALSSAQTAPQITPAQIQQSKEIAAAQKVRDAKVEAQVVTIMKEKKIAATMKSAVEEFVMAAQIATDELQQDKSIDAPTKKTRLSEIKKELDTRLQGLMK